VTQRKVRTSRQAQNGGAGIIILAIGIGLILADDFSIVGLGKALALAGLIFACYQRLDARLKERTAAANQEYQLGVDIGYERGYEDGHSAGFDEGHAAARPVVIDLAAQREMRSEAVKPKVFSSAAIVGDRD
jgi:hypothetical protein